MNAQPVLDPGTLDHEDLVFFAEVHRVVSEAIRAAGGNVPAAGSQAWWSAGHAERVAGLLVLAEAQLVSCPAQLVAEMFKETAAAVISSGDFPARPSHAELRRERAKPGPLACLSKIDHAAQARWVQTGSSEAAS